MLASGTPPALALLHVDPEPAPTVYPGPGFFPSPHFELGNGDRHGLYWPLGRENDAPIVAEMWHDEWRLEPHSSSLAGFLAHVHADLWDSEAPDEESTFEQRDWLALCERADLDPEKTAAFDDPRSPTRLVQQPGSSIRLPRPSTPISPADLLE